MCSYEIWMGYCAVAGGVVFYIEQIMKFVGWFVSLYVFIFACSIVSVRDLILMLSHLNYTETNRIFISWRLVLVRVLYTVYRSNNFLGRELQDQVKYLKVFAFLCFICGLQRHIN